MKVEVVACGSGGEWMVVGCVVGGDTLPLSKSRREEEEAKSLEEGKP